MLMNKLLISILFILFSLSAFTQEEKAEKLKPSLAITKIDTSSSDIELNVQVQFAAPKPLTFKGTLNDKEPLPVSSSKTPVNLWVLLDSSALCKHLGFEKYVANLIPMLKQNLHKSSIVSILSYRFQKEFHFYNHSKLQDLKGLNFECEPNERSVSYDEALKKLLDVKEKVSLPTHVWVFSSGNALLDNTVAEQLKKRDISVHLIVYNPVIKFQIDKVAEATKKQLGSDLFSFILASTDQLQGLLPSSFYKLELNIPRTKHGTNQNVKLTALDGEEKAAETFTSVLVKRSPFHDVINWLIYISYALGVFLVFYILYKLIKYYLPKKCTSCGQFIRHSDEFCLNCQKGVTGFLIVNSVVDKKERTKIVPLGSKKIKIGTNSSSKVKLNKTQNGKAINYFSVKTEYLRLAGRTFIISPNSFLENVNVKLNGSFLSAERYLASGDTIEVPGYEISFFFEKENENA